MGRILDGLRDEFDQEATTNIFGRKVYKNKGSAMLYLGARLKDAEYEKKNAQALAHATETVALRIIGRYDLQAASEFYSEVQAMKMRYLDG